jgi:hypothetical protein
MIIMFGRNKQEKHKESREERFKRVASRRVREILNKLRLLGNCSNTAVYSYNEEDKKKIFSAIDNEIKRIKALFDKPSKENKFVLE